MKFNQETLGALRADTGMVKIAGGTITNPIPYLALDLPNEFIKFRIEWDGLNFNVQEDLSAGLSFDAGLNFVADNSNFDSYFMQAVKSPADSGSDLTVTGATIEFGDGTAGTFPTSPIPTDIVFDLFPGSATSLARGFWTIAAYNPDATGNPGDPFWCYVTGRIALNPAATVPPTFGRANLIQFQPYGNADFPPTSGHTITAGSYRVWGIT